MRWIATRSYAIYLLHTLILYRVYENTVGSFGKTGAVLAFLLVTALASEVLYRFVEVPAALVGDLAARIWSTGRRPPEPSAAPIRRGGGIDRGRRPTARNIGACPGTTTSSASVGARSQLITADEALPGRARSRCRCPTHTSSTATR